MDADVDVAPGSNARCLRMIAGVMASGVAGSAASCFGLRNETWAVGVGDSKSNRSSREVEDGPPTSAKRTNTTSANAKTRSAVDTTAATAVVIAVVVAKVFS